MCNPTFEFKKKKANKWDPNSSGWKNDSKVLNLAVMLAWSKLKLNMEWIFPLFFFYPTKHSVFSTKKCQCSAKCNSPECVVFKRGRVASHLFFLSLLSIFHFAFSALRWCFQLVLTHRRLTGNKQSSCWRGRSQSKQVSPVAQHPFLLAWNTWGLEVWLNTDSGWVVVGDEFEKDLGLLELEGFDLLSS